MEIDVSAWVQCWELHFSWFLKNHTPECNEVKAWSKTWREVKWSRTKHLETAKNSSLKVLSITTGEQGQFAWSLPRNVTVINDCYLNNSLFCHKRTPTRLCKAFKRTGIFICVFFWFCWLHVCSNTCKNYAGEQFHTLWIVFFIHLKSIPLHIADG